MDDSGMLARYHVVERRALHLMANQLSEAK